MPVAGLYCKWLIEGEPDARLSLRFLDVSIKPVLDDCRYDGLVVYDGGSTGGDKYGMYCITKPGHDETIFNCSLIYCNITLLKSCSPMYSYHVIRPSHIDRYPVIRISGVHSRSVLWFIQRGGRTSQLHTWETARRVLLG